MRQHLTSSMNMRRLAQFVRRRLAQFVRLRLRASACVSRLRASACIWLSLCVLSRVWLSLCVCVRLRASASASACVCLASVSVCASASVSRLRASASACVCVRLASACVWLSLCVCVCVRLRASASASACVCLASVSRLAQFVRLRLRLRASRVCVSRLSHVKGSECSRLSASVVLFRICLSPCECLRGLAHFMRRSSFKEFKRFLLSYNVPMPKYPSHHLIYVFYHPMPIMPLY